VLRPELAMPTLVAITPVFIVFLFAQRALVTGMLAVPRRGDPVTTAATSRTSLSAKYAGRHVGLSIRWER
jgi:hypothetical protein